MREIDKKAGIPLCFLLSLLFRCARFFSRSKCRGPVTNIKRLLIVKPAEMGSTVLTYSSLLKAREQWPDCEIYFLVFAENTAAVRLLQMVPSENVFEIRTNDFAVFLLDSVRVLCRIRRMKFDVAVDMEFFSRGSAVLTALSGSRASSGFNRYSMEGLYKGTLLTHPVQYNCHIHTAASFVTLVEALSHSAETAAEIPLVKAPAIPRAQLRLPEMRPSNSEIARVMELVKRVNPAVSSKSRLIILNVNASDLMPLRKWPLENFIDLGRRFLVLDDVFIVLTGVAAESGLVGGVVVELGAKRCVNLVGQTSIHELLVLYSLSALMVTNDSGPSHFAGLTTMPCVTLFGPETPELYAPLGVNKLIVSAGLACSPCVSAYNHRRSPCRENACMKAISVDKVYAVCSGLLGEGSAGSTLPVHQS